MSLQFVRLKTMVMIFALVLGNVSPGNTFAITASVIAPIAASLLASSTSLIGKMAMGVAEEGWTVTCTVQVNNWTRYPLILPMVRIANAGAITTAATSIMPRQRDAFAVRKPREIHEGVWGAVSWEMLGANRRFVLMWSVPWNNRGYSNTLGLGITRVGVTEAAAGNTWYEQMYEQRRNSTDLKFVRGEYKEHSDALIYRDDKFEIEGTMGNTARAHIYVTVRPITRNLGDLALNIRRALKVYKKQQLEAEIREMSV